MKSNRCAAPGCGRRAVHGHHALTVQLIRREGGDPRDPRVLVPLCVPCHFDHHGTKKLSLRALPDSVFEFAADLLGGPAAYETLRRYYLGSDPRHEALLS
jgi:hypothetical protein